MLHPSHLRALAAVCVTAGALFAGVPAAQAVQPTFSIGPDGDGVDDGQFLVGSSGSMGELCTGDFDGDGHADLVAGFAGSVGSAGAAIKYGDGTGHLPTGVRVATTASEARCEAADFDGDGIDDLAIGAIAQSGIQIVLGRTDRALTPTAVATAQRTFAMAGGDFDGDGRADVVLLQGDGSSARQLTVMLGDGDGGFAAAAGGPRASVTNGFRLLAGDLNNDDRSDAVVMDDSAVIESYLANLSGNLDAGVTSGVVGRYGELTDVTGDGSLDLVFNNSNSGNGYQIAVGNGAGLFSVPDMTQYAQFADDGTPLRSIEVKAGDLNNDGREDLLFGDVAGNWNNKTNMWALAHTGNNAAPFLSSSWSGPWSFLAGGALNVRDLAIADFNEDGRNDIVAITANGGLTGMFVNTTAVPAVRETAVSGIGTTTATVTGTVAPNGFVTEYGLERISASGSATHLPQAGTISAGGGAEPVSIPVTGLTGDTEYRYRIWASSPNGDTVGRTRTFRTTVAAPTAAEPPQLSGTAVAGQTLSCSPGTFAGTVASRSYQWRRGGTVLSGETGSTYTLGDGDVGQLVSCRVTATNPGGSASSDSPGVIVSARPAVPAPAGPGGGGGGGGGAAAASAPASAGAPAIIGRPAIGRTVGCDAGTWTGGGRFAYAWLRDGVAIPGASRAAYDLVRADGGKSLVCRVTVTNDVGSGSASSSAVRVAAAPCVVPKLAGVKLATARKRLTAAGCRAGKVTRRAAARSRRGKVLRSTPAAGSSRPAGTRVGLTVGR